MFNTLATKLALRKVGLSSKDFDFSSPEPSKKLVKKGSPAQEEDANSVWPAWMTVRSLPLTVQPWLSPVPPPVPVAGVPIIGQPAPQDRDRRLTLGDGRRVLVVFLRCVGCAFAQKTFLALRALANRHQGMIRCIAVSHASPAATQKWLELFGGRWNVEVVVDEARTVYAAWGLGIGSVWYVFNPTSQIQGFKDKGWLGARVAESLQRTGTFKREQEAAAAAGRGPETGVGKMGGEADAAAADGPLTTMGNKWQEHGAFAVDGRGTVVWGGKALRSDEDMDFDAAVKALGL